MNDDVRIGGLVRRLTLEEKVRLLTGRDSWSLHPLPSIGLRSIVLSDGPVGVRGDTWDERSPSVNFPSPTAMAASWDPDVLRRIGEALGREARRKKVDVVLAPTINLHRTPYGGRHFEAFSEDPMLTGTLARHYVDGIQSQGVGATVKHYVANDSETERFTVDVQVDERTLRELYLLAFEEPIVVGGAWLVMSAYNSINGATATESPLLRTPLNDEWAFDGVVVSDWTAVRSIESARHEQDLVMPGPDGAWGDALLAAVRAGEVPEAAIDRKVVRLLRLAERVGALEGTKRAPLSGTEEAGTAVALEAAVRGTVLLRNDGILPLAEPPRIAVIGEGARWARTQGGGSATVIPASVSTPLDAIRERWPAAEVSWSLGAVVQSGIADLEPGSYTFDDIDGMEVRYFDAAGAELARERRTASGIVSFDAAALASRSALVEMAFRYTPEGGGDSVPFAVAGVSDWEIVVEGRLVASGHLRTRPGDDPATAILTPPWAPAALAIPGGSADITVRFRPQPSEIAGALALRVGRPPLDADGAELVREAAVAAADADLAIIVVSTSADVESEGFDRSSLALPGTQDELVRAVAAANPRTIVVVNSGAPVVLPWADDVAAVLAVWFPGQEFGAALAAVLSGDAEPAGRLPVTWPGREGDVPVTDVTPVDGVLPYREGLHIGYRAWLRTGSDPAYPFGWGLGYTTWTTDGLEIATDDEAVTATVTVTNSGRRSGRTVVQLYASRPDSALERPATWLVGFAPVNAAPGESVTASMRMPWRRLAHWQDGWQLEQGGFELRAALHVGDPGVAHHVEAPTALA
jgi:beta-glucosidase